MSTRPIRYAWVVSVNGDQLTDVYATQAEDGAVSLVKPGVELAHKRLCRATGKMAIMMAKGKFSASWLRECAEDVSRASEVLSEITGMLEQPPAPAPPLPDPPPRTRVRKPRTT